MNWLYIARILAVAALLVAERITFIAPHNPGPKDKEMAKYSHADTVTRIVPNLLGE